MDKSIKTYTFVEIRELVCYKGVTAESKNWYKYGVKIAPMFSPGNSYWVWFWNDEFTSFHNAVLPFLSFENDCASLKGEQLNDLDMWFKSLNTYPVWASTQMSEIDSFIKKESQLSWKVITKHLTCKYLRMKNGEIKRDRNGLPIIVDEITTVIPVNKYGENLFDEDKIFANMLEAMYVPYGNNITSSKVIDSDIEESVEESVEDDTIA